MGTIKRAKPRHIKWCLTTTQLFFIILIKSNLHLKYKKLLKSAEKRP